MRSTKGTYFVNIGIIYGSSSGATADAAKRIQKELAGYSIQTELHDIAKIDVMRLESFTHLFIGCSTWHVGDLQDDWESKYKFIKTLNLTGKFVALFGAGDQLIYSDTFQDAIGILAAEFLKADATIIGHWPIDGYDFTGSKGMVGSMFIGLALDDDNQANMTAPRIKTWVSNIVNKLNLAQLQKVRRVKVTL
ncbi:MAG: flavodoxin [Trueperaceae bacterium]